MYGSIEAVWLWMAVVCELHSTLFSSVLVFAMMTLGGIHFASPTHGAYVPSRSKVEVMYEANRSKTNSKERNCVVLRFCSNSISPVTKKGSQIDREQGNLF